MSLEKGLKGRFDYMQENGRKEYAIEFSKKVPIFSDRNVSLELFLLLSLQMQKLYPSTLLAETDIEQRLEKKLATTKVSICWMRSLKEGTRISRRMC